MLMVPGAMESGVGSVLFWGSLSFALVIAGMVAVPVNRWLIARGKGHAVVHETGIHGGPSPRVVGALAVLAFIFGSTVLAAEAFDGSEGGHGGGHATAQEERPAAGHQTNERAAGAAAQPVRGLAVSDGGLTLELSRTELPLGRQAALSFRIADSDGRAVRDYDVEHDKRMHLIVVRRDLSGFQHHHPRLTREGSWTTRINIPDAGSYRVFADFKRRGRNYTLAADLFVDGPVDWRPFPPAAPITRTDAGHNGRLDGADPHSGRESELKLAVSREGRGAELQPYLGARGHLVALREGEASPDRAP
jgi:hypothetical protein